MQLAQDFLLALTDGQLQSIRNAVRYDETLSGQIGTNRLRVYYRGGLLMSIVWQNGIASATLTVEYATNNVFEQLPGWEDIQRLLAELPAALASNDAVESWVKAIPFIKWRMDGWFSRHRGDEKAFVQLLDHENNRTVAGGSDYFVCDTEVVQGYGNGKTARFDFVAVHWPSDSSTRKKARSRRIVFGEAKYCDKAISGKAGLLSHLQHIAAFAAIPNKVDELKKKMKARFNDRKKLGFLKNQRNLDGWSDDKPIWLVVLANHDPESEQLRRAFEAIRDWIDRAGEVPVEPKIATANFLGAALFDQATYGLTEFLRLHEGRF